jgi:hypothetical protein
MKLSLLLFFGFIFFPGILSNCFTNQKFKQMNTASLQTDKIILSELNAKFINNFVTMDTAAHNNIIHENFICINSDGSISDRNTYMAGWANSYNNSGYTSFSYTDESIRIFGTMALVFSKTIYTKNLNGEVVHGNSVYTDTYIKEDGKWWCVQAHITPVKNK